MPNPPSTPENTPALEFHPVTPERLADLDRFSQTHGKFRYCSCMRWRLTSTEYQRSTKETRVAALDERVRAGTPVGVLAYLDGEPVGWCSVAPRETYAALERYKALARVDDAPVWSVVCFFVDRSVRRRGVTLGLLRAAVEYAHSCGVVVVEGYPVEHGRDAASEPGRAAGSELGRAAGSEPGERSGRLGERSGRLGERSGRLGERLYTYMGSPETFRAAGFHDVTPPGRTRLVLRYVVDSGETRGARVDRASGCARCRRVRYSLNRRNNAACQRQRPPPAFASRSQTST